MLLNNHVLCQVHLSVPSFVPFRSDIDLHRYRKKKVCTIFWFEEVFLRFTKNHYKNWKIAKKLFKSIFHWFERDSKVCIKLITLIFSNFLTCHKLFTVWTHFKSWFEMIFFKFQFWKFLPFFDPFLEIKCIFCNLHNLFFQFFWWFFNKFKSCFFNQEFQAIDQFLHFSNTFCVWFELIKIWSKNHIAKIHNYVDYKSETLSWILIGCKFTTCPKNNKKIFQNITNAADFVVLKNFLVVFWKFYMIDFLMI